MLSVIKYLIILKLHIFISCSSYWIGYNVQNDAVWKWEDWKFCSYSQIKCNTFTILLLRMMFTVIFFLQTSDIRLRNNAFLILLGFFKTGFLILSTLSYLLISNSFSFFLCKSDDLDRFFPDIKFQQQSCFHVLSGGPRVPEDFLCVLYPPL